MTAPQTHYARHADGLEVGYQVVGQAPKNGQKDVLVVFNAISNIEVMREQPLVDAALRRLEEWGRVVVFDKLGSGVSDPLPTDSPTIGPTTEQGAADMLAVLDAVGIEKAVLVSTDLGGWSSLLFAATHPERVESLVLTDTTARVLSAVDYPIGLPAEQLPGLIDMIDESYGHGGFLIMAPELYADEGVRAWAERYERLACPRRTMLSFWRSVSEIDLRSVLPQIRCPTLVIHHDLNPLLSLDHGRYLHEHIFGSKFVPLDGAETVFFADERIFDHVISWLGGVVSSGESDRRLATVMFTDIVDSTETASRLGDQKWRGVLDMHDTLASTIVDENQGTLVKYTGDGILATFDGPARAVRCGTRLMAAMEESDIAIRCGIHAGEIELRGKDIGGIAVHIASRVMSCGRSDHVVVSRTVKDLTAGSGISYTSMGSHPLKGLPEEWELFSVGAD